MRGCWTVWFSGRERSEGAIGLSVFQGERGSEGAAGLSVFQEERRVRGLLDCLFFNNFVPFQRIIVCRMLLQF